MEFNRAYNRETFMKFLEVDFLPQDFIKESTPISITHQTNYIKEVTKLGVCESLDLVVYEVKHSGKHDPRVGLSKESFKLLAQEWQGKALITFIPMDNDANYRFSYISIDLDITEQGKIKRLYSNPRRYSYYLGDGIACHTPNKYLNSGRVKDPKDLQDRFSVEVLTRAFYNELSDWYAWAITIVRFPNILEDPTDDDKYNHEAVIRLVTRLIFVWFIKQRGLIPSEFFDEKYIANNLLKEFDPNNKINLGLFGKTNNTLNTASSYYKGILQNLFFAMLNSPIASNKGDFERRFMKEDYHGKNSDQGNKKLMRYKNLFSAPDHFVELANKSVPFLNGGLFDCLDNESTNNYVDGFSDKTKVNKWLVVPDFLFFGDEVGKNIDLSEFYADKKKKRVNVTGIIDILKRYNFTVEENTPFDQEVSLDPELLGKVFENLLAMYNPETKATARKQTGSFYTPREIVQYMVDESLVAHLKRTVGEDLEDEYRRLMRYTDEELSLNDEQKRKIINSLHDCKILDPACGSGAFPMGVLQQMVHILSRLDETNEIWKGILLDDAADETRTALKYSTKEERAEAMADIERSFDESINRPDYARKLYLIEKCIYGVDIQSIAIQISKLRFFISLVIDQRRNTDPTDNFGIRPLPNLEAKFVAANTLIGLNKTDTNLFDTPEVKVKEEELKVANHKIFGAKTFKTKTKYRESVRTLRTELSDMLLQLGYVSNDTAQLLKGWDMFDQNASSPFFDPEWMFGVHDGFDIVIGNPPYVGSKGNEKIFQDVCKTYFGEKYYSRWMDLFYYFFHVGINSLSENGILSYITTNYYYNATGAVKLRTHFKSINIEKIVDFGEAKLFESALGQHNAITILRNNSIKDYNTNIVKITTKGHKKNSDIKALLSNESPETSYYKISKSKLYSDIDNQIVINVSDKNNGTDVISTMSKNSLPLSFFANVTMGLVTLSDTVSAKHLLEYDINGARKGDGIYVLSENEIQALNLDDECMEYIKPFYKNSDIKKYYSSHKNSRWLIYVKDEGIPINLPIQIKTHFERFSKLIIALKSNFLKNEIAASVVKKWFNNGNYFVLFTPKKIEYFTGEKIIAPYRAKSNIFSYSNEPWYASKDVAYILPYNTCYTKYLLAILNSKLILYWLNIMGKKKGDTLELYAKPLKEIPIKDAHNKEYFIHKVDEILKIKEQNPQADTSALEAEIDQMVYALYNLTLEEINLIENR